MKNSEPKTTPVTVSYGQDTAAYYNETIQVPVEIARDEARLSEFLKARAEEVANDWEVVFDPNYEFVNLRVVCATVDGKVIIEDCPVEMSYHDAGLVISTAIREKRLSALLSASDWLPVTREQIKEAVISWCQEITEA